MRLHRDLLRSVTPALILWIGAACASTGSPFVSGDQPKDASTRALLTVENDQFEEMRVYAVRDGARIRVGIVEAHTTKTLRLPVHAFAGDGTLRLLAESWPSRQQRTSDPILVEDGGQVSWWMAPGRTQWALSARN